jgi:hypothetical protein
MDVGDKIAFYAGAKSVIGEKIPKGLEPYSEFRPDEHISSIMPMISINARMITSIFYALYGNKILIELKRKIEEIYNE